MKKEIILFLYKHIKEGRINRILLKNIVQIEGGYAYSETIRLKYSKLYNIKIGYGTYGGCFDIGNIPPNVIFGNYCSIAAHVRIFRANHPINLFTTHPILYNPIMGYVDKDLLNRPPLTIGHDVWIGSDTIILPSVSYIGNGSIIGAGSVVTKNVREYTIVAGNPAKFIKNRFDQDTIKAIEVSQWWHLKKDELIDKIDDLKNLGNL